MWEEDDNGVWKGRPQYRITDHLGNSMVFFDDKNDDGSLTTELDIANNTDGTLTADDLEVVQRLWYYPFGMHLQGIGQLDVDPSQRYRYNGKEYDESVGLYDYGARYYDPAIARWTSVDALADDPMQVDKSPYAYAWNNPILLTDPDGNCPKCFF